VRGRGRPATSEKVDGPAEHIVLSQEGKLKLKTYRSALTFGVKLTQLCTVN